MMRITMELVGMILKGIGRIIKLGVILIICSSMIYIGYKGNQPMHVPEAPKGMTYFEFMADRLDAARTVKPARCGWGMILSLAVLGPVYSVIYMEVGIHPDGFLARETAPDPDIPNGVAGAHWYEVPGIWWNTVERLSWTMLGKPVTHGCKYRPVRS
jgi:hypothetical protein